MRQPRREIVPFFRLACAAAGCLAALCACVPGGARRESGVMASRVTSVSREYRPPYGGQTIQAPQRMADVATLWKPLTAGERARLASRVPRSLATGARVPERVEAWLPPSEKHVMRDYLYRLTVSQPEAARRAMARAAPHLPMIRAVLADYGLPPELASLPLVESAFEVQCVSSAGAAGLWQLMPVTARRFGLTVAAGRDERFDPRKSTEAAARYLAWLHEHFNDWPLALAAYNCGEGAMDGFLRRHGAASLAELSALGPGALPAETQRFVPQFVAAATVMAQSGEAASMPREREAAGAARARSGGAARRPSDPGLTLQTRPAASETPSSLGGNREAVRPMRRMTP